MAVFEWFQRLSKPQQTVLLVSVFILLIILTPPIMEDSISNDKELNRGEDRESLVVIRIEYFKDFETTQNHSPHYVFELRPKNEEKKLIRKMNISLQDRELLQNGKIPSAVQGRLSNRTGWHYITQYATISKTQKGWKIQDNGSGSVYYLDMNEKLRIYRLYESPSYTSKEIYLPFSVITDIPDDREKWPNTTLTIRVRRFMDSGSEVVDINPKKSRKTLTLTVSQIYNHSTDRNRRLDPITYGNRELGAKIKIWGYIT